MCVMGDTADVGSATDNSKEQRNLFLRDYCRIPRWVLASAVLCACVYGLLTSAFQICSVETATEKAEKAVTRTCDGPGVTDAGVVAIALLIVLLIAPDMSEVGVFGVSLKRRLAAAERDASDSKQTAENVATQLQLLRIETLSQAAAVANAQASVVNNFGDFFGRDDAVALPGLESALPVKGEAFTHDVEPGPKTSAPRPEVAANFAQMVNRLIWNWEVIAASLDLPPYPRDGRSDIPRLFVSGVEAARFANLFSKELRVVRAARNSVAHARAISEQDLQTAVDLSEQLLGILEDKPDQASAS